MCRSKSQTKRRTWLKKQDGKESVKKCGEVDKVQEEEVDEGAEEERSVLREDNVGEEYKRALIKNRTARE